MEEPNRRLAKHEAMILAGTRARNHGFIEAMRMLSEAKVCLDKSLAAMTLHGDFDYDSHATALLVLRNMSSDVLMILEHRSNVHRVSHDAICECGETYGRHPQMPGVNEDVCPTSRLACDGRHVKL